MSKLNLDTETTKTGSSGPTFIKRYWIAILVAALLATGGAAAGVFLVTRKQADTVPTATLFGDETIPFESSFVYEGKKVNFHFDKAANAAIANGDSYVGQMVDQGPANPSSGLFETSTGKFLQVQGWYLSQLQYTFGPKNKPAAAGRAALGSNIQKWPGNNIPFRMSPTSPPSARGLQLIQNAMNQMTELGINFVPTTATTGSQIVFQNGNGCSSFVGRLGRPQPVTVGGGCGVEGAVHEILHAMGFLHEQSRPDRDNFVSINFQNIQPGLESQFTQRRTGPSTPFDIASIMQYQSDAFLRPGLRQRCLSGNLASCAMTTRDGQIVPRILELSELDKQLVRQEYPSAGVAGAGNTAGNAGVANPQPKRVRPAQPKRVAQPKKAKSARPKQKRTAQPKKVRVAQPQQVRPAQPKRVSVA